ncbi:hypothetical protein IGI04_006514 [Brassica rapa subsp. trilocularis]|uniref:DUF287 domain-containing protein n=1 Tax=Brassica rapa subsp. trilocularis TaxID=1813537 RepID=A0ABQ7NH35_BRACM|nr:hypothetical protein IGI04_006514 [Brassica rapa subsp. trilocularis]
MISRRWDPGIRVRDWIYHDQNTDCGNKDFYLARLGIAMGIEKEICGSLWKFQICLQGRWSLDGFMTELRIFTGCNLDRDFLIFLLFLMEIDRLYLIGNGVFGYLWGSRSMSIKSRRYGLMMDYLVMEYMENWVESKWVKVAERGSRKPPTHHGNYRGDGEGFRYKTTRRDEGRSGAPGGGVGDQEARIRTSVDRPREDQRQRTITPEAREEGEIKSAGDEVVTTATAEFQLELAKTQAEGSEVIMEATEEEMGLLKLQGLMEKQDSMAEDIDMELEAINATILESGVELETEEEFQTLSDEEAEKVLEVNGVQGHTEEEEEMVSGEVNNNKDTATGNMATRQSNRKRLFKPTVSIAGSTKMRMASALLSPRKKAVAKMGTRQGESGKPVESKGPSNPKSLNLKF